MPVPEYLVIGLKQTKFRFLLGMNAIPVISHFFVVLLIVLRILMDGFYLQQPEPQQQQLFIEIEKKWFPFLIKRGKFIFIVLKIGRAAVACLQA